MNADLSVLTRQVQSGSCVLFLGAGASRSSGAPTGRELADDLASHFLGGMADSPTLSRVCEYVETNSSRKDLEEYLQEQLGGLVPQGALLEIPKYEAATVSSSRTGQRLPGKVRGCFF